ncbi:hypothetical protein BXY85_3516 [Roseivirga pacifica]|uniref:Uncharacterized protein n=1 Tax=Roseivirga pacifica TaxID=1267423 RepID=A0A1I0QI68_9BACT|nr:hypothetical protein [Roseivirga pacifica]RKQ42899.1 hypothetical protein BXY85_3516 [Roseivirga pacifica]SEW26684.1 hypothetical protein SAMN05216290_2359 [Roseivirga pacifica]
MNLETIESQDYLQTILSLQNESVILSIRDLRFDSEWICFTKQLSLQNALLNKKHLSNHSDLDNKDLLKLMSADEVAFVLMMKTS